MVNRTGKQNSSNIKDIPLGDIKRNGNNNIAISVSVASSGNHNRDLCDTTACLEFVENEEHDDAHSSCKVCAVKQASRAVLLFESIPLSLKLIFIVFFAIVSLLAYGIILIVISSEDLKTSNYIHLVTRVSTVFSDLIQEIQAERSQSIMFSVDKPYEGLVIQINKTNIAIGNYLKEAIDWNKDIDQESQTTNENNDEGQIPNSQFVFEGIKGYNYLMDYYLNNLQEHRDKVRDHKFSSTLQVMQFYVDWVNNIIGAIIVMSNESSSSKFKAIHTSYGYMMTLKELINLKRSILIYFMLQGINNDMYLYYNYINSKYSIIYEQFDITNTNQNVKNLYNELIVNNLSLENLLSNFESYILATPNITLLNFTIDEFYYNYSMKIDNLRNIENFIRNETLLVANNLQTQSTGAVVGYVVSLSFVIVFSIGIAIFFSRTIVVPWKRMLRVEKERTKELATSYTQLNLLLERISVEEQKTRKILNSMEDALVTTNSQGYIMHCNDTFYKMFQFTEGDLFGVQHLRIQQIIPNLELTELFQQFNTLDTIITPDKELKALTKVGKDFPVRVSLNFCRMYLNDLATSSFINNYNNTASNTSSRSTINEDNNIIINTEKLVQQEEACIILIHNLSEKFNITTEKDSQEIIEFKTMFNNPLKKLDFKEFCKRFKSDENLSFLEEVQIYKNTLSLQERAQKQQDIYNTYLKQDAKKLLNISKEQIAINNFKISKGLGEIELFDGLEKIVIETVVGDIYKRWKEHEKSEMQSYL
ncbi:hypothetical protein ABK040_005315 [Willaertia magna]